MPDYHIGTEDIHFQHYGGDPASDVVSGPVAGLAAFRSDWVRCGLAATTGIGWRAPLPHMSVSTDEFWLYFRLRQQATVLSQSHWLRLLSGGFWRLQLYGRQSQLPILYRRNDDLTTDILATGTLPMFASARLGRVDIYCNLGTGRLKLYLDRALALDFTGDLTNSGEYSAITGYDLTGGDFQGSAIFSEAYWRSEDTRSVVGVRGWWPDDDGVTQEWTGVKADVDEIIVDETDANYTDTVDKVQLYKGPLLPSGLTGNIIVGSVMLGARMATNPTDEALVVHTGGTDYLGTSHDTGGAIEDRMEIWEQNPDTSADWQVDEINDAAFNMGVAST